MKTIFIGLFAILCTSISLKAQNISQLRSCTTHACIDKWITNWERSFTNEAKALGKLNNKENRMNRIVQLSERYQMPTIGYERGTIRAWVNQILQAKDVSDDNIQFYLKKLDEAQDRCIKVCQDEMRGH